VIVIHYFLLFFAEAVLFNQLILINI